MDEIKEFKTRLKNATTDEAKERVLKDFCAFVEKHKNDKFCHQNPYHGTTLGDQMKKNGYTGKVDDKLTNLLGKSNPKYKKEKWDINIEYLNNYIKDQNSSVELDMLTIQSFMSKRNQALQMSSTIMKKSNEVKEAIIRSLG